MTKLFSLSLLFLGLTFGLSDCRAARPPTDVAVHYAIVPPEQLSEAVKGLDVALPIEAAWREKLAQSEFPTAVTDYSIVIFVDASKCQGAIWGELGIPVQGKTHLTVNVTLSAGYRGTYVLASGGTLLHPGIPEEPKPYEWLEFHRK